MLDTILDAGGIDPRQWRALVRTAIRMEFRGASALTGRATSGSFGPVGVLALIQLMSGAVAAGIVVYVSDLVTAATICIAYSMFTVAMMVVLDFHTIVLSALDYLVLGFRPISSRTYFAARATATLFYVVTVVTAYVLLPAIAFAWRTGWNPLPALAFAAAGYGATVTTAFAFVLMYAGVMSVVPQHHLRQGLTVLQILALTVTYAAYGAGLKLIQKGVAVTELHLPDTWARLLLPPVWYASLVGAALGDLSARTLFAILLGATALVALVTLAGARISLRYAERLLHLMNVPAPPSARAGSRWTLGPLLSHESRAVSLLVRRQFRYDMRFRMTVLSIVPLTLFYLYFGWDEGSLFDPFTPGGRRRLDMAFMVVAMMPQLFHAVLLQSDHYRAAWIFFATPADRRALVMALKNVVAIYLLIPYLLILGTVYAISFRNVYHAAAHVLVLGLIAHCFLQFAIAMRPGLPFARRAASAEYSASTFTVIIVSSAAAGVLPVVFATLYPRPWGYWGVLATVVMLTTFLELLVFARIKEKLGRVEYRG